MDCLVFRQRPDRVGTLLTLHGFLGDETSLAPIAAELAAPFARVDAVTLPGHGDAPWDPSWRWNSVIDDLCARLEPDGATVLVGYSMGARVGLSLVLARPECFAGAVLVGVDPGIEDPATRAERTAWERAMSSMILADGLERFVDHWETLPVFASQRALEPAARAQVRSRRTQHRAEGVAWAMEALGTGAMPSQWAALSELSVPVTVLTGALDEKFTAIGARMASRSARVAHAVVAGVGHDVTLEAPEAVIAAARELTAAR
jgi:2-succinyl-6-hydroxy-2,4-cyclohexadiene-1-carboxylate synthase